MRNNTHLTVIITHKIYSFFKLESALIKSLGELLFGFHGQGLFSLIPLFSHGRGLFRTGVWFVPWHKCNQAWFSNQRMEYWGATN